MKWLACFVIVIISGETGLCSPTLGEKEVASCGGKDCTKTNSDPFKDILKSIKDLPKVEKDKYVCVDLVADVSEFIPIVTTTSPIVPSGLSCKIDKEGKTVECNNKNVNLPDNIKIDGIVGTGDYVCLDASYRSGELKLKTNKILQCALKPKDQDLCALLKKSNDVTSCTVTPPDPVTTDSLKSKIADSGLQKADLTFTDQCALKYSGEKDICALLKEVVGESRISSCTAEDTNGGHNLAASSSLFALSIFCIYLLQ